MALYAFDGTWDKGDSQDEAAASHTNVFNFLPYYATHDPDSSQSIEGYEAGVGTRLGVPGRIVGGFFGAGGRTRIEEMIESFRQNWRRNRSEDRTVDIIGFSRGAALAVHFSNQLAKGVDVGGERVVPDIRFLGVWDIVPSFGLPGVLIPEFHDINIGWDLDCPKSVRHCFHAMGLDERRQAIGVHRLDPSHTEAPRIQELWFRGTHGDIGGGNGNLGRCDITLAWMLQRAAESGLPISIDKLPALQGTCNPLAPVSHNNTDGVMRDRLILANDQFHPSAGRRMDIGESADFDVDSKMWFDFTGLFVSQGGKYLLTPDPNGRWTDGTIPCNASGWPAATAGQSFLTRLNHAFLTSRVASVSKRVPGANWFEMIACVGTDATVTEPIGHNQHANDAWTSTATGPLFFFANDARVSAFGHDFYQNNEGTIRVHVSRLQ